jgi:putative endonuclease
MSTTRALGDYGESLAADYLANKGYAVIAKNYRTGRSELDIITKKDGRLVFFEIKTRNHLDNRDKEVPLNREQTDNLKRGVIAYCIKNCINLDTVRLDLLLVSVNRKDCLVRFKHYRDIF